MTLEQIWFHPTPYRKVTVKKVVTNEIVLVDTDEEDEYTSLRPTSPKLNEKVVCWADTRYGDVTVYKIVIPIWSSPEAVNEKSRTKTRCA